jgi:hypothetical protein
VLFFAVVFVYCDRRPGRALIGLALASTAAALGLSTLLANTNLSPSGENTVYGFCHRRTGIRSSSGPTVGIIY